VHSAWLVLCLCSCRKVGEPSSAVAAAIACTMLLIQRQELEWVSKLGQTSLTYNLPASALCVRVSGVARQLYFWCGGCCRGTVCAHAQLVVVRSGEATGYIVIQHCMLLVTAFLCRGWRHLERAMYTCVVVCARFELEEHSPCDVSSMLTGALRCCFVSIRGACRSAGSGVSCCIWAAAFDATVYRSACCLQCLYGSGHQLTTTCNPGYLFYITG
jgi:hypothetical protein